MMSMPTSLGSLTRRLRMRRDGWHGGAGVARDARVPRGPIRDTLALDRDLRGWGGCASARPPDPGTGPVAPRSTSLDGHGFREIARLIDIVPAAVGDVIREKLKRNDRQHRLQQLFRLRYADDLFSLPCDLVVIVIRERDQHAGSSANL